MAHFGAGLALDPQHTPGGGGTVVPKLSQICAMRRRCRTHFEAAKTRSFREEVAAITGTQNPYSIEASPTKAVTAVPIAKLLLNVVLNNILLPE